MLTGLILLSVVVIVLVFLLLAQINGRVEDHNARLDAESAARKFRSILSARVQSAENTCGLVYSPPYAYLIEVTDTEDRPLEVKYFYNTKARIDERVERRQRNERFLSLVLDRYADKTRRENSSPSYLAKVALAKVF